MAKSKRNLEYKYRVKTAFFHTIIGNLLPFIIACIPLIILWKLNKTLIFLDKGHFCIYSAGLFSTALYLFKENETSITNKCDKWLDNVLTYLLVVSGVIFASLYLVEYINSFLI